MATATKTKTKAAVTNEVAQILADEARALSRKTVAAYGVLDALVARVGDAPLDSFATLDLQPLEAAILRDQFTGRDGQPLTAGQEILALVRRWRATRQLLETKPTLPDIQEARQAVTEAERELAAKRRAVDEAHHVSRSAKVAAEEIAEVAARDLSNARSRLARITETRRTLLERAPDPLRAQAAILEREARQRFSRRKELKVEIDSEQRLVATGPNSPRRWGRGVLPQLPIVEAVAPQAIRRERSGRVIDYDKWQSALDAIEESLPEKIAEMQRLDAELAEAVLQAQAPLDRWIEAGRLELSMFDTP